MRISKRELITFVALSLVSLFADVTYEGARSVLGAYFKILGATAFIVGFITIGDLLGYLMRGVGGFLAGISRSSKTYWSIVLAGYGINLFAVPLLAFAGRWDLALALVLIERIGKGIRAPARDVILAEVTENIGKGKGFGLHELMDQIGGVTGPLFVAWSLYSSANNYKFAFMLLSLPAVISIVMLLIALINYPEIKAIEKARSLRRTARLGSRFWFYTIAMVFLSLGYIHWSITAFHMKNIGITSDYMIAFLYTIAMLSDAIVAFPAGYLYDKVGLMTLLVTPPLAFTVMPLLLQGSLETIILATIAWGIVMGIYETNMRVAVADIVEPEARAYAYGIYGMAFGFSWAAGNILMGYLYGISRDFLMLYSLLMEIVAFTILGISIKGSTK